MDNNTQQRILATTYDLLMRYGISSVTMDFIAKECKVSKRTLYETFTDKVSLIKAVLDWHRETVKQKFAEVRDKSANSLEALLNGFVLFKESVAGATDVFVREIHDNFSPAKEVNI
ncbi:MAG: TetR/AcrR family transcriptional regulator [Muribaculaceae bacterium]|nr:TetR/AcrR family transcriptional regulator [Muribaculaceae bacterium]